MGQYLNFVIAILLFHQAKGCSDSCSAIGLADSNIIPDISFTTSSIYSSSYAAHKARFSVNDRCWAPRTNTDENDYLQIDLGQVFVICAVATKGNPFDTVWTTEYKISTFSDNNIWITYTENNNSPKLFTGNTDRNTPVKNDLVPVVAKSIRFIPTQYNERKALRVEVYAKAPPQSLVATAISSTSIKLSWTPPPNDKQNGHIRGYKVLFCKTNSDCDPEKNITDHNTNLNNLTAFTNYTIKVSAFTDEGNGLSAEIIARTLEGLPSQPTNVTLLSKKKLHNSFQTEFVLGWSSPSSPNGIVRGYKVSYWKKGDANVKTEELSPSTKSFSFTGCPLVRYVFAVRAYTVVGDGEKAEIELFNDSLAPPSISHIATSALSSEVIRVTWKVNTICHIPMYKLRYRKQPDVTFKEVLIKVTSSHSNTYTLTKLEKGTTYSIGVQTVNDVGFGSVKTVTVATLEDKPDAPPQEITATSGSSTSITLSWKPPPSGNRNGAIKGYKIIYCKSLDCSPKSKDTQNTQTTLNNLEAYTSYSIQVLAYTSAGDGPKSNITVLRTAQAAPSKPINVKTSGIIAAVGSTGPKVKVDWEPPSSSNGVIRGYRISYGPITGDENRRTFDKDARTYTFYACGGASYKVKVWAFTVADGAKVEKSVDKLSDYEPFKATPPTVTEFNTTTFQVEFAPLPATNGRIVSYDLQFNQTNGCRSLTNKTVSVSCGHEVACRGTASGPTCNHVVYDLQQCSTYLFRVRGYTSKGPGPFSEPFLLKTSVPARPTSLTVLNTTKTSAFLEWMEPQQLARPVKKYIIFISGWKTYNFSWPGGAPNYTREYIPTERSASVNYTVTGLYPSTRYSFTVVAETECGKGKYSHKAIGDTGTAAPPQPLVGIVNNITTAVANITLWTIPDINGKLDAILVYVHEVKDNTRQRRSTKSSSLNCEGVAENATKVPPDTKIFTLGDPSKYNGSHNNKLEEGKHYEVYQCGKTDSLYGEMVKIAEVAVAESKGETQENIQEEKISTTEVVMYVGLFFIILLILAIILLVIYNRRLAKNRGHDYEFTRRSSRIPDKTNESKQEQPIGDGVSNVSIQMKDVVAGPRQDENIYDNKGLDKHL